MVLRLLLLLVLVTLAPVARAQDDALAQLLAQDARLAAMAERLLGANAPLCRQLMPLTGMILSSRDQYPAGIADAVFANGPVVVAQVLPGSAAQQAGVLVGDGLAAVAGSAVDPAAEGPLRDAAFAALADRWAPGTPLGLTLRRDGQERTVTLAPPTGCRALVEIRTDAGIAGRSDGRVIQLDLGLMQAGSDGDVAAVLAHELGHVVLEHRRRLGAAGVAKGLAGEWGRNRRLSRLAEEEADRISVHLLANAGYDPSVAPAFWRSPLGRRAAGGLLRNRIYPAPRLRAEALEAEIARLPTARPDLAPDLLSARDLPLAEN